MINRIIRRVKLHAKYRASRSKLWMNIGVGWEVPWLNVSGKWLAELGFNIGDEVRITASDQMLIIEPVGSESKAVSNYKSVQGVSQQTVLKLAS